MFENGFGAQQTLLYASRSREILTKATQYHPYCGIHRVRLERVSDASEGGVIEEEELWTEEAIPTIGRAALSCSDFD